MLLEVLLLEVLLLLELVEPLPVVCPGAPWDVPLLWLLVVDAALIGIGVTAFRRRDLRC